ncbi:PTS system mannose/fructose/sorbose family transporter subunit IID [Collinsella aerofaciens]|uniref:PTS system mannose/fructose/sorbose family transporter subunit IID n=1 Tax=Collinsella TaxID=102106 RepID=UPI001EDF30CE|nr:PTS system mannose/fructose/sorbose family transporter subunit IID [Collinsella aerofaciens]MCG4807490.1 PTS system mannose/fructose/sorbose family transporter subunit IID [Collinsella aerofaciens]MCG4816754.1 PTS system mannose/fructose/sorbose family transporter subunit IID [Collinsella aerofaciens]
MGLVFGLMVKKMLKKIWHDDPAGYTAALERHAAFVNITVMLASFVGGIAMSMEERIKAGELPPEFVNDVKAVLMGQLSGVGDTIFLTTIRVVAACIAVSMAAEGNPLGPILFPLIFNVPQYILRVWGIVEGYELGVGLFDAASESGIMDKLIKDTGIVGMMVVGSMTCSMFWATLAVPFGSGEEVTVLQDVLDGIMPGMPGLGCMGIYYWLLGKKIHPSLLILGAMVVDVAGVYLGVLA